MSLWGEEFFIELTEFVCCYGDVPGNHSRQGLRCVGVIIGVPGTSLAQSLTAGRGPQLN